MSELKINVLFPNIIFSYINHIFHSSFNKKVIFFIFKVVFWDIIDRLKVFDSIEHLINLLVWFFSNVFALEIYMLIESIHACWSKFSVSLDLAHQVVCEFCHLMFSLHYLLNVYYVRYISNHKEFVSTTCEVYINLVESDVLCILAFLHVIFIGCRRQFISGSSLVFG